MVVMLHEQLKPDGHAQVVHQSPKTHAPKYEGMDLIKECGTEMIVIYLTGMDVIQLVVMN
jgi:hypothetical protein